MNIEEAEATYFSSVIEYAQECSEHEKDEALIDFNINKANFLEKSISLEELNKYSKIHISEYDLDDSEKTFENQKFSSIIIVHDRKNDEKLIIDGNHRVNTFAKIYPEWEMNVVVINSKIFKNMGK